MPGGTKTRQISAVVFLFVWKAGDFKGNALLSSSNFNEFETKTLWIGYCEPIACKTFLSRENLC